MQNPQPESLDTIQKQAANEDSLSDTQNNEFIQTSEHEAGSKGNWLRRNFAKTSGLIFLGGTAVTLATNPLGQVTNEVIHAAPWVGAGLGVSESLWIGGAAMMAGAAGKRIGNPFSLHSRFHEVSSSVFKSRAFKTGLAINTIGALGTAGTVATGAVTSLPVETWPGAVGLAGADVAATVALRAGVYANIKNAQPASAETETSPRVKVRKAALQDIERLADIDLLLFDKAYGTAKPEKQEIVEMLTRRLQNNPDWMFVAEMNGKVEGFMSGFKTRKPVEEFVSWDDSTANGTLDGKVDPDGQYVYVSNMTIKHEAVVAGAEDMLVANLFANGIQSGTKYGYFVSRMPHFKRWVESQAVELTQDSKQQLAEQYLDLRREEDDKRYDPQLRMYEGFGFKLIRMVPDAFEDDASLDYGVVFKAPIPGAESVKKIKPGRLILAATLRQVAKHPKVLQKLL